MNFLSDITVDANIISTRTSAEGAPFSVVSNILNTNLNADLLDDQHGSYYLNRNNHTGFQLISTVTGLQAALDTKLSGSGTYTKLAMYAVGGATLTDSIVTQGFQRITVEGVVYSTGFTMQVTPSATISQGFALNTTTAPRWFLGMLGAEPSGDVGSDLYLSRFGAAGFLGNVFIVNRATGVLTFNQVTAGVTPTASNHYVIKSYSDAGDANGNTAFGWGNHAIAGYATSTALTSGLAGKENSFSKGSLIQGSGVNLSGTLTNRLVGAGDITVSVATAGSWQNTLAVDPVAVSMPVISRGVATSVQDYLQFKPTDFGTGKPYLAISKHFTANKWEWYTYDGVSNAGALNFAMNLTRFDVNLVDENRSVLTGAGLTGGGTLATNRTLSVVFGTTNGTVAQGDDTRINNGQTAFGWGNHAGANYISGTGTYAKIAMYAVGGATLTDSIVTQGFERITVAGNIFGYGFTMQVAPSASILQGFALNTPTEPRWLLGFLGAESAGNVGSDLYLSRFGSAFLGNVFIVSRATGVLTFNQVTVGVTPTASNHLATKGYVDGISTGGNLVAGTGVTLSGTLTNRLVGAGNITINASASGSWQDSLVVNPVASTMPIISRGSSTTALDYIQFKPTDYGTGKPYLGLSKSFTANKWEWYCYDGVSTTGNLNFALNLTRFDVPLVDENRTLTINGTSYNLSANRSWTIATGSGTVTSVGMTAPTGFYVSSGPVTSSGNIALEFASGYSLPTTGKQGVWDGYQAQIDGKLAYDKMITINGNSQYLINNPNFTISSGGISGGGSSGYVPLYNSSTNIISSIMRQTTFSVATIVVEGGLYINGGGTSFYQRTETQKNAMSASVGDVIYQTDGTEGLWMRKSGGWVFVG